jgi:hypothetical protein
LKEKRGLKKNDKGRWVKTYKPTSNLYDNEEKMDGRETPPRKIGDGPLIYHQIESLQLVFFYTLAHVAHCFKHLNN